MSAAIPYNPSSEPSNSEQVVAAYWECLRRNPTFRAIAEKWVSSQKFRFQHCLTAEYHHPSFHYPRCALDCMLAPSQRVDLFRLQLASQRVFRDTRFNFGPIVQCQNFGAQHLGSTKPDQFLTAAELVPAPPPLTLNTSWPKASEEFRRQFAFSIRQTGEFAGISEGGHLLNEPLAVRQTGEFAGISEVLRNKVNPLRLMARRLAAGASPEEVQSIARELWLLSDLLHEYGEFYKVFAIPNGTHTAGCLERNLTQIREAFEKSGMLVSDKKFNLHKSYFGTTEDWRWFLEAEARGLDANKSVDLYKLATIYSENLRQTPPGRRRRVVQTAGFRGAPVPSKLLKSRRITLRRHIQNIRQWIEKTYPPTNPAA